MEVSETGRSFRFTWKLKNFSFLWHREHQFLKWTFNIKRNIISSWSLLLYPSTPKNSVSCILRKESGEPLNFLVDYELSFLHEDGSPLHSIKVSSADFNYKSKSVQLWLHHDEILENRKASSTEDTLSISCRVWTAETPIQEMVRYFAETEIQVQRCTLTWHIFAFSDLKPRKKRTEFVKTLAGNPCIYFSLFLDEWNRFVFEIFVIDPKCVELCKCQILLVDVSGKKFKCGRFEVVTIGKTTDPDWKFHLSLTKRNLMESKELYLPNDTLTLQCEVAFASGIEIEPVQQLESDCLNIQNIPCKAETANISESLIRRSEPLTARKNDMQSSNSLSLKGELMPLDSTQNNVYTTLKAYSVPNSLLSWKDDLLILYENGIFCDTELLVTNGCFPVHSLILSIRSPVFCDQLICAKSDGKRTSIYIEDLDVDTIRKMILFLYTDTLEDLEWNCAKSLYSASNKYKILPLKDISSSFLKQNLNTTNCCSILPLADRYKDNDLKQAVQDFTSEHDEVLNSDQWRSLEESHPHLIIETFHFMHLKLHKK